jgi:hypothetical protein
MKLKASDIEMTCTLVLNRDEVLQLNHLSSFGKNLSDSICVHVTQQYPEEVWTKLFEDIQSETHRMAERMNCTEAVFKGQQKAVPLPVKDKPKAL